MLKISMALSAAFLSFSANAADWVPTWDTSGLPGSGIGVLNGSGELYTGTQGLLEFENASATASAAAVSGTLPQSAGVLSFGYTGGSVSGNAIQIGIQTYNTTNGYNRNLALNPNEIYRTGQNGTFVTNLPAIGTNQSRVMLVYFIQGSAAYGSPMGVSSVFFEPTPALAIKGIPTNSTCAISWSGNEVPWVLQMTTNLNSITNWINANGLSTNKTSTNTTITMPENQAQGFFRLKYLEP